MCPACMASAALVAGSVVSTGGLTALAVKVFRPKKSGQTEVSENVTERTKDDGCSDKQGTGDGRATS